MADYQFDTITAAQALAYNAANDTLAFAPGTNANTITVLFIPAAGADPARVSITVNGVNPAATASNASSQDRRSPRISGYNRRPS